MKKEDYGKSNYNSNYNSKYQSGNYGSSVNYKQPSNGNSNIISNNSRNLYTNLLKVEFIKEISVYSLEFLNDKTIIDSNNIDKLPFSFKKSINNKLSELFSIYDIIGKYIFSPIKLKEKCNQFNVKFKEVIKINKSPSSLDDKECSILSPISNNNNFLKESSNKKSGSSSTDFDKKEEIEVIEELILTYVGNINSPSLQHYETILINRRTKEFYKQRKGIVSIGRSGIFDFNQAQSKNRNIISSDKLI